MRRGRPPTGADNGDPGTSLIHGAAPSSTVCRRIAVRADQIAKPDGLAGVLRLVTALPVDPYVFNREVAAVVERLHLVDDALVVDRALRERRLEAPRSRTAAVEVAGV